MEIINHFNLICCSLLFLIWSGLFFFLWLKKKKSFIYLLFFTIYYIYLGGVLYYTLFQYQSLLLLKYFTPTLILHGQESGKDINFIPLIALTIKDLKTSLLNILLFLPFGFGLPFITNFRIKKTVVYGLFFSLTIEIMQLITGILAKTTFRIADINDIIFNVLGTLAGYILFILFMKIFLRIFHKSKIKFYSIGKYIASRPQLDSRKENN